MLTMLNAFFKELMSSPTFAHLHQNQRRIPLVGSLKITDVGKTVVKPLTKAGQEASKEKEVTRKEGDTLQQQAGLTSSGQIAWPSFVQGFT